jgi:hypothetical protein
MIDTSPRPHPQGLPGNLTRDFVGVSHDALLGCFAAPWFDAEKFCAALVEVIEEHGATHNQRELIHAAMEVFQE